MGIRGRLLSIVLAAVLPLPFVALFFASENPGVYAIVGLAVGVFGSTAALLTARNILMRLQRLERAVRQIDEGDFSACVPESETDEIATLGRAFNAMVDSVAERRDRFAELDTLKSEFVSSVSHELRTPLTTIKALTRLLIRGESTEEKRREYLETISVEWTVRSILC